MAWAAQTRRPADALSAACSPARSLTMQRSRDRPRFYDLFAAFVSAAGCPVGRLIGLPCLTGKTFCFTKSSAAWLTNSCSDFARAWCTHTDNAAQALERF